MLRRSAAVTDPTEAELAAEEAALVYESFTNDDGVELGMALLRAAKQKQLAITIDVRRGEQQLFHAALNGTTADNDAWVERKARVVRHFEQSSFRVGCMLRRMGGTIDGTYLLDAKRYGAHGGAFPIRVKGAGVIGVVTVSGLPERDDHELVVEILSSLLAK
jgi:uncharacterized protein (UPF0303 family)